MRTSRGEAPAAQCADEDHYVALVEEPVRGGGGGFPHPDCFWSGGGMAVYGGFTDA